MQAVIQQRFISTDPAVLHQKGFTVSGVDPSNTGIAAANATFPSLNLKVGSAYDPLHELFGT